MTARNFGLKTKNVTRALVTAYQLKSNGDNSKNNCKSALSDFAKHLKEQGINDLRRVQKEHVMSYADKLSERYENGDISASTAQNYLSSVNVAMENARLDRKCHVDGVREANLPNRTGIATDYKGVTQTEHDNASKTLSERLRAQLNLQRELGLRFKESSLLDAHRALKHAETTKMIRIEYGTKGGRSREFAVSSAKQIEVLRRAAQVQGGDRSLIPKDLSWAQYQTRCYRELKNTEIRFHGERHHFANARYEALTGVQSPVQAGISHGAEHHQFIAEKLSISLSEAKLLDEAARLQVSQELGHSRVSITNNYLG